jgi:hypothetical protein
MKITIQSYGNEYSVQTKHDGISLAEMMDCFRGLLVQAGFHPESVDEQFTDCDIDAWFTQDNNQLDQ